MTVLTSNYKIQDISLVKLWDYSIELLDKSNHNYYHIYLNISVVFQSCYSESVGEGWGGGGGWELTHLIFDLNMYINHTKDHAIIKKNDKMNYNI